MRDMVFNKEKTENRMLALEQYAREAGISPAFNVARCNPVAQVLPQSFR